MSTIINPTEKDYRAWLAFLWTGITAGVVILMVWRGYSVQDAVTLASPFLALCGVFINSYFKSKE